MTKKTHWLMVLLLLSSTYSSAQENHTVFVNLGGQGIEASYKYRLTYDLHAEAFIGVGPGYQLKEKSGYYFEYGFIPFAKANVKWHFVNEEDRKYYLAAQTKYSFGKASDVSFNKVSLVEGHVGNEQYITKRLLYNIHVGGGYIQDFDVDRGEFLFTFGATLKYALFKGK